MPTIIHTDEHNTQNNNKNVWMRIFSLSPYIATYVGLYIFHNAIISLLIYHTWLAIALIIYRKNIDYTNITQWKNKKLLLLSVIIALLSGVIVWFARDLMKNPDLILTSTLTDFHLSKNILLPFLLYFSTVHPILEELYRRFLLPSTAKYISASDILFAWYHFEVLILFIQPEYAIVCTIALIIVARIRRFFKNQLQEPGIVILSHAIADFSIFLAVILLSIKS